MNPHDLYGMPVSQDEAKNQFNEICLLKQEFLALNSYAKKGEATDWAIESYFMGIRPKLRKPLAA